MEAVRFYEDRAPGMGKDLLQDFQREETVGFGSGHRSRWGASHSISVPSRHGPPATPGSSFELGVAPRFAGETESPTMSRLANLGDGSGAEHDVGLLRLPCPCWPAPVSCRFTLEGEERKGTLGVKATSKAPTSRRTVQDSAKTGKVSRTEARKAAKKVTQKRAAAGGR